MPHTADTLLLASIFCQVVDSSLGSPDTLLLVAASATLTIRTTGNRHPSSFVLVPPLAALCPPLPQAFLERQEEDGRVLRAEEELETQPSARMVRRELIFDEPSWWDADVDPAEDLDRCANS